MLRKRLSFFVTAMLLGTAAMAASPAEFLETGLGGLTLQQPWDARAKDLGLKDIICKPGDVPDLADTFCFFRFPKPVELGAMATDRAGAILFKGKVVAVTLEAALDPKTATTKLAGVVKELEGRWGSAAKTAPESHVSAFIATDAAAAVKDPEAFLATPSVVVKPEADKTKVTIMLAGMELASLLSEASAER